MPSPPASSNGFQTTIPRNVSFATISANSDEFQTSPSGNATPQGSYYNDEFRFRTMVSYLHNRAVASGWMLSEPMLPDNDCSGVLLKRSRGSYITVPNPLNNTLLEAVIRLNLNVATTIRPQMLDGILASLTPGQMELKFNDGSQIQVLDSLALAQPATVRKFQYACVFRQERLILVWHDEIANILPQATMVEEKLLSMIWGDTKLPSNLLQMSSRRPSSQLPYDISNLMGAATPVLSMSTPGQLTPTNASEDALEKGTGLHRPESVARPVVRTSAFFIGLSFCLSISLLMGIYVGKLITECILAGEWTRMALAVPVPLLMCVSLFFFQIVFTNLFQMIGPIGGVSTNSRYFSAHKPCLRRAYADGFTPPKVTIQMPVYKEGMESVIIPTVRSLQAAISHYESHGGSANIFINDDGLRAGLTDEQIQQRRDFYADNRIGWVARPKHNGPEGFFRKGKFKKASNMNFALHISQKVEALMQERADARFAEKETDLITEEEEEGMYQSVLKKVLEENPLAWADGDIRVGEIILLVDSDTRV
ncbi:hypothetical protein E4U54_002379, partial [Claviceps lovelessii]